MAETISVKINANVDEVCENFERLIKKLERIIELRKELKELEESEETPTYTGRSGVLINDPMGHGSSGGYD